MSGVRMKKKSKEKLIHSDLKIDERRKPQKKKHRVARPRRENRRHHLMDEQALNYEVHKVVSGTAAMMLLRAVSRSHTSLRH